jgi:sterol desaturase/sphingolipid hydroxylase (fatty acid hydroxylase superfamily)
MEDNKGRAMFDLHLSEPQIRLLAFGSIFLTLAVIELVAPRLERDEMHGALKTKRWITNLSLVVLSSIVLRVVFPLAAVGTATWAATNGYGVLPMLSLPPIFAGIMAFIILDFAVWFEHLMSHKIELLWRIHRMHHADTGFDLTTALRFHPLEIILSMFWKAAIILIIGPPVIAVLIFEIVLNGAAMFNHANIKLPLRLDRVLRKLIVTPDMHRVHHSIELNETNSNYGFNLSIWDQLFGTYISQPRATHDKVEIGLKAWRDEKPAQLLWALKIPFVKR